MAVFTGSPSGSTQYNLMTGAAQGGTEVVENLKLRPFSYTHTLGAGTGEVNLVILPEGKFDIYSESSRLATSAFGAGSTLSVGYRSYTEPDGDVIAATTNTFMSAGGAAAGIVHAAFPLPAAPGVTRINYGKSAYPGFVIYGTVAAGNVEDTDTIAGWVAYASLR